MDTRKPFKGRMENWRREHYADGYIIRGRFMEHPKFGFSSSFAHTSLVLKEETSIDGIHIETLNSRYLLVGKDLDA